MRWQALGGIVAVAVAGCGGPPPPREVPQAVVVSSPAASESTNPAPTPEPRDEYVPASADTAAKGRIDSSDGYLGAVIKARTHVANRMNFLLVDHAMDLFRASEDRYPESHEEFMEKIIAANQIQLPSLYEGEEYVYDPEQHELMVHRTR